MRATSKVCCVACSDETCIAGSGYTKHNLTFHPVSIQDMSTKLQANVNFTTYSRRQYVEICGRPILLLNLNCLLGGIDPPSKTSTLSVSVESTPLAAASRVICTTT